MAKPSKGITPSEVDLVALNSGANAPKPLAKNENIVPVHTPFETPAYLRAYRLFKSKDDPTNPGSGLRALAGTTLEVDAYTFGVKVFIRFGMDGTLKVFAEDGDGTIKLEEWSK